MDGFRTIVRTLTESRGLRRPERLLPQGSGLQLWGQTLFFSPGVRPFSPGVRPFPPGSRFPGVRFPRVQTEFQVNLKLGLNPPSPELT